MGQSPERDVVSIDTAPPAAAPTPNVAAAIETVASHLHPVASYDLADHPKPTGREEVWRFTPIKRLRGLLDADGVAGGQLEWVVDAPDGVTTSQISTVEAVALGGPAPVDRISALAVARAAGVVKIDIPADVVLDDPVIITLTGSGIEQPVFGHLIINVGAYAKGTIVLEHLGSATIASSVSVLVGDGAQVEFVGLQLWADDTVHAGQVALKVGRDAQVRTLAATLGGDLVRLVETVEYAGPGGSSEQFGLYFADAGQHLEHRLFVDHGAPQCRSNVEYKGALQGDTAHTVWVGDVLIRASAEGTDTYELNRNLVLTEGARADSVPNLEIETGEIKGAGHASATGRFDDQQLFYLMARGIPEDEARRLVVRGFFASVVGRIGVPEVQEHLMAAIERELAGGAA